jgi:hypothetical protein
MTNLKVEGGQSNVFAPPTLFGFFFRKICSAYHYSMIATECGYVEGSALNKNDFFVIFFFILLVSFESFLSPFPTFRYTLKACRPFQVHSYASVLISLPSASF